MKFLKRILCLITVISLLVCTIPLSASAAKKTIVQQRIEAISKVYPQNSAFNEWVLAGMIGNTYMEYGGCSGLAAYVTKKVFGISYCKGSADYTKVGTASTSSNSAMKKLFASAKIGDVIEWTKKGNVSHHAIFLSDNSNGVKIYEANFNGPNQVWYNHQWNWSGMKTWPVGGADKVTVYRAKNYNAVNNGKSAKEDATNTVYTLDEEKNLKIKVVNSGIGKSTAVVVSGYKKGAVIPKYIAVDNGFVSRVLNNKNGYKDADANSFRIYIVATLPGVSSKVTATVTSNSAKLSWKKVSGATGYRIYRYDTKTKKLTTVKTGITSTAYNITGLNAATSYTFTVRAYKTVNGNNIWAAKSAEVTAVTKPKAPTLTLKSTSKKKASVKWSNVSGESGYQVSYRIKGTSKYVALKNFATNKTNAVISGLKSGKTYQIRVRSFKKTKTGYLFSAYTTKTIKIK